MVQTRQMASLQKADSSSDLEMETSPRIEALPAPTQPELPAICQPPAQQLIQHQEPTIMPISQSDPTFEHLITTLPTAVKIEELDFTF
jgi:hypothetical protein